MDEDVYAAIATALRRMEVDAINSPESGRHHAGIVVSSQRPIGDLLRRLIHLAQSLDADAIRDRLEFLSDW